MEKGTREYAMKMLMDFHEAKQKEEENNQKKSKGLGDTIEKFTKATGIKKVVDKISDVTEKDCGCEERKKNLNRLFPYNN